MRVNPNDVFNLLRKHAETYVDAKCMFDTYNKLVDIKTNSIIPNY